MQHELQTNESQSDILRFNILKKVPLVSICIVSYNHEEYISEAIESILMQITNFDYEIVIGEDCSTDSTKAIVREYELKYPEIFHAIYQATNVGRQQNIYEHTLPECKGKYIAYLEGDDYWTDPYKLQKQVNFMESNPEYSVSFHRYKILDQEENTFRDDGCGFLFPNETIQGVDVNTDLFLANWITQSLTMVYRKDCFDFSVVSKYNHFWDIHHIYHLLQNGKGYLFPFEGGVYREHLGGLHSKKSWEYRSKMGAIFARELYLNNNKDKFLKENYIRTLQWKISCFTTNHYDQRECISSIFTHLYYSGSIKRFIRNWYNFIKNMTL